MGHVMSIVLGAVVTACAILLLTISFVFLAHIVADMTALPLPLVIVLAFVLALGFILS